MSLQGKEDTLKVTLSPRPETPRSRAVRSSAGSAWLGIAGQTLTPQVAQAMRLSANQHGVLVEKVERGSPAWERHPDRADGPVPEEIGAAAAAGNDNEGAEWKHRLTWK